MSDSKHYVLGIDLDNVTANYTKGLRDYMVSRGFSAEDMPEPTDYDFVKAGWPFKDREDYMNNHMDFVSCGGFLGLETMLGASETLHKLVGEGVRIRVVTHRLLRDNTYAQSISDTVRWLDSRGIPFHDFCAISQKSAVGVDMLVDDAPSNVESVREGGGHVAVFDHPYNRHLPDPRVGSWDEIYDLVQADKSGELDWDKFSW